MPHTYRNFTVYPLDQRHQNQWCLILCKSKKDQTALPYLLSLYHEDSKEWEDTHYLRPFSFLGLSYHMGIIYISQHGKKVGITPIHQSESITSPLSVQMILLSRLSAAVFLTCLNPAAILKTFIGSPQNIKKRLRTALNQNYTYSEVHLSYEKWCELYDIWEDKEKDTLYQSPYYRHWPVINVQIYCPPDVTYPDTDKALDQQWTTPKQAQHSYVAILQNGEKLSQHALAIFADQAARYNFPAALYADSDLITPNEQRDTPHFKPDIGYLTLLSGILTQDIWLFRQDIIEEYQQKYKLSFQSAYTHRLALALYIWEQKLTIRHVPFILSHRLISPGAQAVQEMQQVVHTELSARKWQFNIQSTNFPLTISLSSDSHPVSLVIPTTLSSKIICRCIQNILSHTNYPDFEAILVISQEHPFSRQQRTYMRPLLKHKNLRVVWLKTSQFNFSASCNFGIQHAKHDFIGVINDDISPQTPLWLRYMMGHMQDPTVGAVGAKLYYPNGQIQHGGILMGAANLCEHIGRFQKSKRFTLHYDHDVSAVTAACMVLRRSAYTQVNGFDENYEIAYNDVDLCLKLRQANFHIIQCQHAELTHYESLSLGNHYTGVRAGKERQEILSIRLKYKATYENDPFYNPNLSLQRGKDGTLAFPPRISRPFAVPFSENK